MSTVTTSPMPPPVPDGTPPGSLPPEPPRRGWWLARRFLAATICIVALAGGATYTVIRDEVNKVVKALGQNQPVKVAPKVLIPTSTGQPETLLLVGNDERKAPKDNPSGAVLPHSNEMLLVRVDPSKPTISMLSIPRELRVSFAAPNGEVITNRINSAYTYGYEEGGGTSGGVKLMLETIKSLLGITVNHVFVTDFKRFEHAVDEMGCVYMTVDKRYFHSNSEPGAEQYFEINLKPGYQRLCGQQALEFVANRHESTSLIRDARDQRFLLDAKAQYGPGLFGNREKFEKVLGKAVQTDLHGEEQVLDLLELLAESAGKPVRQVPFHVNLLPTYDTATSQQLQEAAHSFMAGTAAIPKHKLNSAVRSVKKLASHCRIHTVAHAHSELDDRQSFGRGSASAVPLGGASVPEDHCRIRPRRIVALWHPESQRSSSLPLVCDRRRRWRTGSVLRHPGHHLDRFAAVERSEPECSHWLAYVQPFL